MCLNLTWRLFLSNWWSLNRYFQGQIKEKQLPYANKRLSTEYIYFVKKTEKLNDKYSQPSGNNIPSQEIPWREAGGERKTGRVRLLSSTVRPIVWILRTFLLPRFFPPTLKGSACCKIRLNFLFNRRKREKQRRNRMHNNNDLQTAGLRGLAFALCL